MNPKNTMLEAISMGEKGRFLAPPNPWVGCVIVKNNEIIAKGHTLEPGHSHAEDMALKEAGNNAEDATLYVTLEPCSHIGKTPSCALSIIKAGIKEVFIAITDPDEKVSGKGITLLKEAGIKVHLGLCENLVRKQLKAYLYQRTTKLPYTVLKAGLSIDGRVAAGDHTSQWITPVEAREDSHLLRTQSQAIVIGSGTAIQDNPSLTIRNNSIAVHKQPLRVILDSTGKVPPSGPLFDCRSTPTCIMTTTKCSNKVIDAWEKTGAKVYILKSDDEGLVDLHEAWKLLATLGVLQVLVEGGSKLHTRLLQTKLVNQLSIYIGPILLGNNGLPFYDKSVSTLTQAPKFHLCNTQIFGDCVRLDYST